MRWFYSLMIQFLITPLCYCTFLTNESYLAFPFPPPPFLLNTIPAGYNQFDTCMYGWILVDAELNQLATVNVDYTSQDISNLQAQIQTMIAALNQNGPADPQKTNLINAFTAMQSALSASPIDVATLQTQVGIAQTNLGIWGSTFPPGGNAVPDVPSDPTQLNVYLWFLHFYYFSFINVAEGLIDPMTYFIAAQPNLSTAINNIAAGTAFNPSILSCGETGMNLVYNSMLDETFSLDVLVAAMPYFRQVFLLLAPPGTYQ